VHHISDMHSKFALGSHQSARKNKKTGQKYAYNVRICYTGRS